MAINWQAWRLQRQQQLCWQLAGSFLVGAFVVCGLHLYRYFQLSAVASERTQLTCVALEAPRLLRPQAAHVQSDHVALGAAPEHQKTWQAFLQWQSTWPVGLRLASVTWHAPQLTVSGTCHAPHQRHQLVAWLRDHPKAQLQLKKSKQYVVTVPLF